MDQLLNSFTPKPLNSNTIQALPTLAPGYALQEGAVSKKRKLPNEPIFRSLTHEITASVFRLLTSAVSPPQAPRTQQR